MSKPVLESPTPEAQKELDDYIRDANRYRWLRAKEKRIHKLSDTIFIRDEYNDSGIIDKELDSAMEKDKE